MLEKGFNAIQQGVQIDELTDVHGTATTQLVFPNATCAYGFYLLFYDYHWESSNYQCMVVQLSNKEYQKLRTPETIIKFADTSKVTPDNVQQLLIELSETIR